MEGVITLVTIKQVPTAVNVMMGINYRQMGKLVSNLELVSQIEQALKLMTSG